MKPDDLVANVLAVNSFELDYALTKIGGPIDRDEWGMTPQTVNAYYHPMLNEIVFPAAILQPPFFDMTADDAVNYGGIGAVIGHEIGHGFDDQGSTADGEGRLRDWWQPADREAFEALAGRLVDQYDGLVPEGIEGASVNGELTIGENIGDLGGLGIAYKAWLLAGGDPDGKGRSTASPAQQFLRRLGAGVWRGKRRRQRRSECSPPTRTPRGFHFAQVINAFGALLLPGFRVTQDDALWLAPEDRVVIW